MACIPQVRHHIPQLLPLDCSQHGLCRLPLTFRYELRVANRDFVLLFRGETSILRRLRYAQSCRYCNTRYPFASFLMNVVRDSFR
jgi:hypothetical protein